MLNRRILIIDDDEKFRKLLSSIISSMGFEVSVASGGNEALTQFHDQPFDLVLTDLNMPGMDGWSLAHHIKAIVPKTPIVLVTSAPRELTLKKIGESFVDLVLFKPFGLKEFKETVQNMLDTS